MGPDSRRPFPFCRCSQIETASGLSFVSMGTVIFTTTVGATTVKRLNMGILHRIGRRREPRTEIDLPLLIWGLDTEGERFVEQAHARAISLSGALLSGVDRGSAIWRCDRGSAWEEEGAISHGVGSLRRWWGENAGGGGPIGVGRVPLAGFAG